jgi:integrase
MPSINKVKSARGAKPWKAYVNVKGFDRVSQRFFTEKEARAWAEPLERKLREQKDGGVVENIATLSLADLAKEYLDDPETKLQKAHADRCRQVAWWVNRCGSERVMGFNVTKVRACRNQLLVGRANGTANRYLAAMRAAWNWGRNAGLVPPDQRWPTGLMLSEPKGRTRYLDDIEIEKVLKAAAPHGPTVRATVLVSIACGMRKGELLRLKWADVDFDAQCITILLSKNGEARSVHLPPSAAAALRALKQSTVVALDAWVFITETGEPVEQGWLDYRWKQIRTEAGLQNFRWHDLRHSCASILAQGGASLVEIGAVLGHKSPAMTHKYSHLVAGKAVKGHAALDAKLSGKS